MQTGAREGGRELGADPAGSRVLSLKSPILPQPQFSQQHTQSPPTIAIGHGSRNMNDACASDSIASWLETVIKEQCHALPDLHAAKRKREHSPDQLTPESPHSMSAKRRRREVEDDDVFATPRALGRAPADTSSTSSISHGNSTGAKTPIKQFQRMEVASRDPVRVRQLSFNDPELPETLKTIVRDLSLFSRGRGFIHQDLQASPYFFFLPPHGMLTCLFYFPSPLSSKPKVQIPL